MPEYDFDGVIRVKPLAQKRFLELTRPDGLDGMADRERILEALGREDISIPVRVLRTLYPMLPEADYRITVTLSPAQHGWEIVRVEPGDTTDRLFGAALDIGSTTLEMALLDLNSGAVLAEAQQVNSQRTLGENILDRIVAVREDAANLERLQSLVTADITQLIELCCAEAGLEPEQLAVLVVAGNTTMMQLLLGCDPWLVFQSPYSPVFFDPGIVRAGELGLPLECNVFSMPAVANYLGGDITSGLLLTDLDTRQDPAMLLDIGTNGELAFGCRDYLLLGAGAAGPALEGAVSEHGMRAEPGAVSAVTIDRDGQLCCGTIGDAPPKGICGSGIMDLIAQGFLAGWIAGNGSLLPERSRYIKTVWSSLHGRMLPAIEYAPGLYFTEADIKEWIKCKAAAFTMVATLLDHCGLTKDDIGQLYLAGGFGTHYKLESAVTTGLYPDIPRERFTVLGNSSLKGAMLLLTDRDQIRRLQHFRDSGVYLQFGEMERFLENMIAAEFLPHTDSSLYPSVNA